MAGTQNYEAGRVNAAGMPIDIWKLDEIVEMRADSEPRFWHAEYLAVAARRRADWERINEAKFREAA